MLSYSTLLAGRAVGLGALIVAAVFFISPNTAINIWPWRLTPLTARVIASFTAQVGVGATVLSRDRRWSGWRLIIQTFLVATAFLLVGAGRAWDDFNHNDVTTYLYVGGLLAADLALLILYNSAERRARAEAPH